MRRRVDRVEVVRVVGRDDRHVQLARDRDQARVDDVFLGHPVAHDLDVEAVAENVDVGLGVLRARSRSRCAAAVRRTSPDMQPERTISPSLCCASRSRSMRGL